MTDIVLSVVKDRCWPDLDCYAISLARSGFAGRKVVLVEDVPQDAQDQLAHWGFEVVRFQSPSMGLHFQTTRYINALDFLGRQSGVGRVFWSDACDVVFQADPMEALGRAMGSYQLAAAKEGWAIKNQAINDVWIQKIGLSEGEYRGLREQEVLCSGTVGGTYEAVCFLFDRMIGLFHRSSGMQGIDQGIFNHVVRTKPFCDITRIPEPDDAFVATCGIFLSPSDPAVWTIPQPLFDDGLVYTKPPCIGGRLFAVQHQYNRHHGVADPDGAWRSLVERRYR